MTRVGWARTALGTALILVGLFVVPGHSQPGLGALFLIGGYYQLKHARPPRPKGGATAHVNLKIKIKEG